MNAYFVRTFPFVLAATCVAPAVFAQGRTEPLAGPATAVKYVAPPAGPAWPTPARAAAVTTKSQLPAAKPASGPAASVAPSIDRSRVLFDSDASGALWARGADYKMSFDANGADFVPFFGSSAPRNFDLRFALVSASFGTTEIALDSNATPRRAENAVTFDRGVVDEVYELAPRGVEQKFVFATLPARGDVHVRIAFESELIADVDAHGWRFGNEYGYVHYGRATAIDALGRTLALDGEFAGNALEFVVPADFAAQAALPLVIDPVIATYSVETGPIASRSPDVVYDWNGINAMHCWEEIYSAADHDVNSLLIDTDGVPVPGTGMYVDYTTTSWERPRVAYQTVSDHYAFTAQVGAAGSRSIWGVVRNPYGSFDTGQFMISNPSDTGEKLNADIGGDPYFGPAYLCVVYERVYSPTDRDIHGRLIDGNGGLPAGTILIDDSAGTLDTLPSISKNNDTNNWNIAWQREVTAGNHDIYGARVFWQGSITYPTFQISGYSGDETNPSAASSMTGTQRFVVAFEYDYVSDHDVFVAALDGNTSITIVNLSILEGAAIFQDQRTPAVDGDGYHFACVYSELAPSSSTDFDPLVAEFALSGSIFVVNEAHYPLTFSVVPEVQPAIASRHSSNLNRPRAEFVVSWNNQGAALGSYDDISSATYGGFVGGRVDYFCGNAPANCPCGNGQNNGAGCPNSASAAGSLLYASGFASTVTDTLTLMYGGMPSGVSALLFQGTTLINGGAGNPFGDGRRCVAAPVYRFPIRTTDGNGYASYGFTAGDPALSVTGSVPSLGLPVHYQVWYRDGASYCTPQNTNFTNAITVYWTP